MILFVFTILKLLESIPLLSNHSVILLQDYIILPVKIKQLKNVDSLKKHLKTYFFQPAYEYTVLYDCVFEVSYVLSVRVLVNCSLCWRTGTWYQKHKLIGWLYIGRLCTYVWIYAHVYSQNFFTNHGWLLFKHQLNLNFHCEKMRDSWPNIRNGNNITADINRVFSTDRKIREKYYHTEQKTLKT